MSRADRDEPYRIALRRHIVVAAHDLLASRISVTEAARGIAAAARKLGNALEEPFVTFVGIDSETDSFPLGSLRERWNGAALEKQDTQRERYEGIVHERALEACREILLRLDPA